MVTALALGASVEAGVAAHMTPAPTTADIHEDSVKIARVLERASDSLGEGEIGLREVVAFAEQWAARKARCRIGQAVAEIQPGWVTSPTKTKPGLYR